MARRDVFLLRPDPGGAVAVARAAAVRTWRWPGEHGVRLVPVYGVQRDDTHLSSVRAEKVLRPEDAQVRFDRVVARVGDAMEGGSARVVATALSNLARAMERSCPDAIERRPRRALSSGEPRAGRRGPAAAEGDDGAH